MKKLIAIAMTLALTLSLLTGCGSASSGSSASGTTANSSEGSKSETGSKEINLFIWTEYMPQEVLDKFEEETGIKVNISTYSSMADMYAKVKTAPAGMYDVIDVAGFYVQKMADEDILDELDKSQLPNIKNINPDFLKLKSDPEGKYTIPYQGAGAFICVNTAKVTKEIKSYKDLFDPSLKNSIVMIKDFRAIIGMMNVMQGFAFDETDPTKLAQTKAKLLELKPNIKLLDSDSPKTAMINGETSVGLIYNGEIAIAQEENPDIKIVYPEEGQYFSFDTLAVSKASKNKEAAHKFLDFIMKPEISKLVSDNFPYINPNQEALKLMDDDFKNDPVRNIPSSVLVNSFDPNDLDAATLQIYNDIWTEFTK